MTTHRWVSSTPLLRTGADIQPGEAFEPSAAELAHFGDQIEALDDSSEEDVELEDGTEDEVTVSAEDPDPDEGESEGETVAFDEDAWFDDHDDYQDRVATVESGDVDAILDEIEDCERSDTVIDAVTDRRTTLED